MLSNLRDKVSMKNLFADRGNKFDIYCRSISAKPTGIKKEKDIPRLPES